jgi:ATP/maltotriose-dependent transcriptional regulator MalT
VTRRVSSPVFVGRRGELDTIMAALSAAADRHGTFLLIAGEAGVGKTRLVDEAVRTARAGGSLAAVGRCVELGVSGVPFAPIRTALRDLVAAASADGTATDDDKAPVDVLLPGLDSVALAGDRIGVGPDTSQARTFEACLDFLRHVAADRPLLLVIEDIHWADPSTLDLLRYLVQGVAESSVVLAATFRSDELHRRHPLQPFLGEIQRARSTERIDLQRFSEDEVAEQLTAILGEPANPALVDRVFSRSDGNAFYAEELVVADTSGEQLPPAMRDVLLARVAALSDPARELLGIVAAGGTHVSSAVIARVAGVEPAELDATLREAVDRHLVSPADEDGEEYLAFRHALVQEAVYGELLPGERSRLHARYGDVLEAGHRAGDDASPELAYHWFAAHDLPRALAASVEAGRYAASSGAYGDAHRHYERALELWDRVPDAAERTGLDRIALLELAASTAAEGDTARAAALMREAVRSSAGMVDDTRAGLLKERYGRYAWLAGDGFTALEACRGAVRLVSDESATTARARVLASLGQILMVTLRVDEAKDVCERAVEAARAAGSLEIESHALDSLGVTNVYLGNLDAGLALLRDALEMAKRIGSVDEITRAQGNLVDVLSHSGRLAEAGEEALAAYATAKELGLGRASGVIDLAEGGMAFYRLGRWDRAGEMLERAWREAATGVPEIMVGQRLAMLDVSQGRYEVAASRIATARPLIERAVEAQLIAPLAEAAAELALWRRDPLAARAEIAAAFERVVGVPAYISRLGPILALGARAEADIAELARAQRDDVALAASRAVARGHLESMHRLREIAANDLPNFLSQADAWLAQCQAELARQEGSDDPAAWARCAAAFATIPMAYPRAYALWRGASATLAVSRDRTAAARDLGEARGIAADLGALPLLEQIDALARRAGIDLEAGDAAEPAPVPADNLGLTRREREILALIATGRSNRQIAEELFITEGTAGTHVSNILGKLGVRGRTEAAAVAYRLGLVDQGG